MSVLLFPRSAEGSVSQRMDHVDRKRLAEHWRSAEFGERLNVAQNQKKKPAKAVSGKSFLQPRKISALRSWRLQSTRWERRPNSDKVEGGSPPGTIAGTGAPGGRSYQGDEDVHREVEETSGFGSRK